MAAFDRRILYGVRFPLVRGSLSRHSVRTLKEGWQRLSFRKASSCEARVREEGLPTGECGTHKEGNGRVCVCGLGAGRKASAMCFALRRWSRELPSANTSSFPVALVFFCKGRRGGRACAEL